MRLKTETLEIMLQMLVEGREDILDLLTGEEGKATLMAIIAELLERRTDEKLKREL